MWPSNFLEPTPLQRVDEARAALAAALDQIEEKLDVPKRVRSLGAGMTASFRRNPVVWIAGGHGTAAVIGLLGWAAANRS